LGTFKIMIVLLSPAKNLDPNAVPVSNGVQPLLIEDANYLATKLKKWSALSLSKMMNINNALGELNHKRYQEWEYPFPKAASFPAIKLFNGEVYRGLDASSMNSEDLDFAHEHVFILSGLYGLLRPLDSMMPYRLEMGTRWAVTPTKKNLYAYWGDRITDGVNNALSNSGSGTVVNLASNEYFKAVKPEKLNGNVITPVFKDLKDGNYKSIMTYAKLARGYMSRFIIKERIEVVNDIKGFNAHGYKWNAALSSESEWTFTRDAR